MRSARARVLLDVDTGIDDALALLYAAARLDLAGVTAVVGNVPVDVAARNAAAVLAVAGAEHVPVVAGAATTATGDGHREGPTNHGPDGLGGVAVPPPPTGPWPGTPRALVAELTSTGPLTVAACAPLSNVAGYLDLPGVERVVMVGGELRLAPEPEFNVGHDPASAATVLATATPLTVYTADVFETVVVPPGAVARLRACPAPAARLAGELLAVRRAHLLGDAAAVVLIAHPDLFEVRPMRLSLIAGQLVPDPAGREVEVVVAADVPAVVEVFAAALEEGGVTGA